MSRAVTLAFAATVLVVTLMSPVANAAQRTFVSTGGSDLAACSLAAPCRSFAAALTHTDANGEIIVLDSGGYGPVTIDRSVAITSPPGVYAGISVFSGNGIDVNTAGARVIVRGLTINGLGGATGIAFSQGALLQVERCTIAGMASYGLLAAAPAAKVTLVDLVVSDSGDTGILLSASSVEATLDRVRVERSAGAVGDGVFIAGTIVATIRDLVSVGNLGNGLYVHDSVIGGPGVAVTHSAFSDNTQHGVRLRASNAGNARLSLSDSVSTRNGQQGVDASAFLAGSVSIIEIVRATVSGNNGNGFVFVSSPGAATRAAVTASMISDNGGDGVFVTGAGTIAVLSGNTLLRNGDHGLEQSSGVLRSRGDNTIESSANGATLGTISPASGPY